MLGTIGTVAKEEGVAALWKGIEPGLHRQCLFGGLRIGLYEPVSPCLSSREMGMHKERSCGNEYAPSAGS